MGWRDARRGLETGWMQSAYWVWDCCDRENAWCGGMGGAGVRALLRCSVFRRLGVGRDWCGGNGWLL